MTSLFGVAGVVKYMTPPTTIGVVSRLPSCGVPVWNTILGTRLLTLVVLIVATVCGDVLAAPAPDPCAHMGAVIRHANATGRHHPVHCRIHTSREKVKLSLLSLEAP